jgi:hypothetical protein
LITYEAGTDPDYIIKGKMAVKVSLLGQDGKEDKSRVLNKHSTLSCWNKEIKAEKKK